MFSAGGDEPAGSRPGTNNADRIAGAISKGHRPAARGAAFLRAAFGVDGPPDVPFSCRWHGGALTATVLRNWFSDRLGVWPFSASAKFSAYRYSTATFWPTGRDHGHLRTGARLASGRNSSDWFCGAGGRSWPVAEADCASQQWRKSNHPTAHSFKPTLDPAKAFLPQALGIGYLVYSCPKNGTCRSPCGVNGRRGCCRQVPVS
jgi:hypothetical protein